MVRTKLNHSLKITKHSRLCEWRMRQFINTSYVMSITCLCQCCHCRYWLSGPIVLQRSLFQQFFSQICLCRNFDSKHPLLSVCVSMRKFRSCEHVFCKGHNSFKNHRYGFKHLQSNGVSPTFLVLQIDLDFHGQPFRIFWSCVNISETITDRKTPLLRLNRNYYILFQFAYLHLVIAHSKLSCSTGFLMQISHKWRQSWPIYMEPFAIEWPQFTRMFRTYFPPLSNSDGGISLVLYLVLMTLWFWFR